MINLKGIAIFTAGAVIGVGGSAMFFKKKYEDFANEEIESVKESSKNKYKQWINDKYGRTVADGWKLSDDELDGLSMEDKEINEEDIVVQDKEPLTKSVEEINKDNQEKALARRTKKKDIIDYSTIAAKYAKNDAIVEDDDPEFSDAEIERLQKINDEYDVMQAAEDEANGVTELSYEEEMLNQSPNDDIPEPEIIPAKSFIDDYPDNEKLTLNYYAEDNVLVDENEEPINHYEKIIGKDTLQNFGKMDAEDNLVYVRNFRFEVDYEIIKLDEKYDVSGR